MKRLERLLLLVPVLGVGLWAFLFSLSVWLIAAFVAGGLCGLFAGSVAIWRAQRALSRSRRAPAAPAVVAPPAATAATR